MSWRRAVDDLNYMYFSIAAARRFLNNKFSPSVASLFGISTTYGLYLSLHDHWNPKVLFNTSNERIALLRKYCSERFQVDRWTDDEVNIGKKAFFVVAIHSMLYWKYVWSLNWSFPVSYTKLSSKFTLWIRRWNCTWGCVFLGYGFFTGCETRFDRASDVWVRQTWTNRFENLFWSRGQVRWALYLAIARGMVHQWKPLEVVAKLF
jgi:hypothetical protein